MANIREMVEQHLNEAHPDILASASDVYNMAQSLFAAMARKYKKYEVDQTSTPAGPDTSKFRATRSGFVKAVGRGVTYSGSFSRQYLCGIQIGGAIDFKKYKEIQTDIFDELSSHPELGIPVKKDHEGSPYIRFITEDGQDMSFATSYGTNYSTIYLINYSDR